MAFLESQHALVDKQCQVRVSVSQVFRAFHHIVGLLGIGFHLAGIAHRLAILYYVQQCFQVALVCGVASLLVKRLYLGVVVEGLLVSPGVLAELGEFRHYGIIRTVFSAVSFYYWQRLKQVFFRLVGLVVISSVDYRLLLVHVGYDMRGYAVHAADYFPGLLYVRVGLSHHGFDIGEVHLVIDGSCQC